MLIEEYIAEFNNPESRLDKFEWCNSMVDVCVCDVIYRLLKGSKPRTDEPTFMVVTMIGKDNNYHHITEGEYNTLLTKALTLPKK